MFQGSVISKFLLLEWITEHSCRSPSFRVIYDYGVGQPFFDRFDIP